MTQKTLSDGAFSFELTGVVTSVEMLGKRALTVWPVDFDPRYVVSVLVESVSVEGSPFSLGVEAHFAIHSPSRFFKGGEGSAPKSRFTFVLEGSLDKGKYSFSSMSLK